MSKCAISRSLRPQHLSDRYRRPQRYRVLSRTEEHGNERVFSETARQKPVHRHLQIHHRPGNGADNQPHRRARFRAGSPRRAGATTIATNLAWRLAEAKRRHTILVDLDLQEGDAALQLDAQGNHALREALDHPERVDKLFLERGVKRVTDRLDLLCSLEPLDSPAQLSEEAFLWLLDKLLPRYRLSIVEIAPSIAAQMTWALRLPSTCLLVSNPSLAGARDVARWNEILGPNTPERHTM